MKFNKKNVALLMLSVAVFFFLLSYMQALSSHQAKSNAMTMSDSNTQIESRIQEKKEENESKLKSDLIGGCKDGDMKVTSGGFAAACEQSRWIAPGTALAFQFRQYE